MASHLKDAGIGTGIHYPIPLHIQKAYAYLNYKRGDFPVAESVSDEIISLPMFPQLTAQQQSRVAREIIRYISKTDGECAGVDDQVLAATERTV
jgi:dTDP-4-amino-4,6-dideoxygalactose transaminase